jgi:hypothetical protein
MTTVDCLVARDRAEVSQFGDYDEVEGRGAKRWVEVAVTTLAAS